MSRRHCRIVAVPHTEEGPDGEGSSPRSWQVQFQAEVQRCGAPGPSASGGQAAAVRRCRSLRPVAAGLAARVGAPLGRGNPLPSHAGDVKACRSASPQASSRRQAGLLATPLEHGGLWQARAGWRGFFCWQARVSGVPAGCRRLPSSRSFSAGEGPLLQQLNRVAAAAQARRCGGHGPWRQRPTFSVDQGLPVCAGRWVQGSSPDPHQGSESKDPDSGERRVRPALPPGAGEPGREQLRRGSAAQWLPIDVRPVRIWAFEFAEGSRRRLEAGTNRGWLADQADRRPGGACR